MLYPWATIAYIAGMRTVIINGVKGSDLPREWAAKAQVRPDERVDVTIKPQTSRESLASIGDEAGKQARARGFTPEKIKEIIPDFPLDMLKE